MMAGHSYAGYLMKMMLALVLFITCLQTFLFFFLMLSDPWQTTHSAGLYAVLILIPVILAIGLSLILVRWMKKPVDEIVEDVCNVAYGTAKNPMRTPGFMEFIRLSDGILELVMTIQDRMRMVEQLMEAEPDNTGCEDQELSTGENNPSRNEPGEEPFPEICSGEPVISFKDEDLIPVRNHLDDVIGRYRPFIERKDLTIANAVPAEMRMRIDIDYLDILLENLVILAVSCAKENEKVLIKSSFRVPYETIEITFLPGPSGTLLTGSDPELPDDRSYDTTEAHRTMRVIRFIVELYGGTFTLDTSDELMYIRVQVPSNEG